MNLICVLMIAVFVLATTTPTPITPSTPTPMPALVTASLSSRDVYRDNDLQAAAGVVEARLQGLGVEYASVSTENIGDLWMSVLVELEPDELTPRVIELITQPVSL